MCALRLLTLPPRVCAILEKWRQNSFFHNILFLAHSTIKVGMNELNYRKFPTIRSITVFCKINSFRVRVSKSADVAANFQKPATAFLEPND